MATLLVRKDGSTPYQSIQSAIYDAAAGDTVNVGAGTFNENVEINKNIILEGAGKDQTFIQGKLANDTFVANWFAGDTVVNVTSNTGAIKGKNITGTNLTSNSKIAALIGSTQIQLSLATVTTGNYSKIAATLTNGSSTIVLPSTTSVAVGHKVEGTGVNATITAWNSTTKTITLSSPVTQSGSNITLNFRLPRTSVTLTQVTNPSASSPPSSIMLYGITTGVQIKNLCAIGFDGTIGQEASALGITAGTSPGHQNLLVDNCRFVADGDSAVMCGSNPYFTNSTFQNCLFEGKTFVGSEPADVPSFSSFTTTAIVQSIGASTSIIRFTDMRGIVIGSSLTSIDGFSGTASVTAISGMDVTINKVITASVGSTITTLFNLVAYKVPNCARNLVYIGQNISPCNTQNITFKNNTIKGQTGAVISSSGNKAMFNSAVTIECVNGLIENNVIDGSFGAGDPNPLAANWALRCRQSGTVMQNNTNISLNGRVNSGFLLGVAYGQNLGTNVTVIQDLVTYFQDSSGSAMKLEVSKDLCKQLAEVQASPTFSNEGNWKLVGVVYKKSNGPQRIVLGFRNLTEQKAYTLKPGMNPNDQFQIQKLIFSNPARLLLVVKRSSLTNPTNYDFILK